MIGDLFSDFQRERKTEALAENAVLLRGFAVSEAPELIAALDRTLAASPLRHMNTPGGRRMSVAMSNCGSLGWVSDQSGYRYLRTDPLTNNPWPPIPLPFIRLAARAASTAGYVKFAPDACLINCYQPGARLSLHQDRNEHDFTAPIVSISLGLPAIFLFGGNTRGERPRRFRLESGDVAVWGGASRLAFHGVAPLADGDNALTGRRRINLTFRKAS
ncbi:MAG: DNA oxidative demethylase AlkB [Acidiphilium sp.]|nr:DNA oxidative demethylase AlkB [Acidiphilium sp.]MDD4936667.1 DNA oxidative demethylase AlkB [Acidiphilium sp.]